MFFVKFFSSKPKKKPVPQTTTAGTTTTADDWFFADLLKERENFVPPKKLSDDNFDDASLSPDVLPGKNEEEEIALDSEKELDTSTNREEKQEEKKNIDVEELEVRWKKICEETGVSTVEELKKLNDKKEREIFDLVYGKSSSPQKGKRKKQNH